MIIRAQDEGVLKTQSPVLLMELVFGAFNGMMRASWESRVEITPDAIDASRSATCAIP